MILPEPKDNRMDSIIAAFRLRGTMIGKLADKCAEYARQNAALRTEVTALKQRIRLMAGHR